MNWLELKLPPLLVMLMAAGLSCALATVGPLITLSDTWRLSISIALFSLGVLLIAAGALAFKQHQTTVNPMKPDDASSVVVNGVYQFTRNPMYVGMLIILLGLCVYTLAPMALLGSLAFAAYISRYQIVPEERMLLAKFGQPYAAYCQRVRRWL